MAIQQPPDNGDDDETLHAEHRMLKQQTAALKRDHDRLHQEGGSHEEHRQHIRKLQEKIKELEDHVERLKNARKTPD